MYESDICEFEQSIAKTLVLRYKMNRREADRAVARSALQKLLRRYPDMVMHYPIEGWSNDVWREYNHLPIEE